jgi:hypothetical protein
MNKCVKRDPRSVSICHQVVVGSFGVVFFILIYLKYFFSLQNVIYLFKILNLASILYKNMLIYLIIIKRLILLL